MWVDFAEEVSLPDSFDSILVYVDLPGVYSALQADVTAVLQSWVWLAVAGIEDLDLG